jgi:hypothetical protein
MMFAADRIRHDLRMRGLFSFTRSLNKILTTVAVSFPTGSDLCPPGNLQRVRWGWSGSVLFVTY